jgi:hypothetical protein
MVLAALSFIVGLILDTVTRGRKEMRLLSYLLHPAFDQGYCKSTTGQSLASIGDERVAF